MNPPGHQPSSAWPGFLVLLASMASFARAVVKHTPGTLAQHFVEAIVAGGIYFGIYHFLGQVARVDPVAQAFIAVSVGYLGVREAGDWLVRAVLRMAGKQ